MKTNRTTFSKIGLYLAYYSVIMIMANFIVVYPFKLESVFSLALTYIGFCFIGFIVKKVGIVRLIPSKKA